MRHRSCSDEDVLVRPRCHATGHPLDTRSGPRYLHQWPLIAEYTVTRFDEMIPIIVSASPPTPDPRSPEDDTT